MVTAEDARDVIELVKTSFDDVFKNEFGALDFTRSQNGSGMSSRNEVSRLASNLGLRLGNCFQLCGQICELECHASGTLFKDPAVKMQAN